MKCLHCRKEYSDSYDYCPYCAEPKPVSVKEVTIDEKIKEHSKFIWLEGLGLSAICFIPTVILIYIIEILLLIIDVLGAAEHNRDVTFDKVWFEFKTVVLISLGISIVIGIIYVICWFVSSRKEKIIKVQFSEDSTSICPQCGSHSISLGRKGYDWNKALWYDIFNLKGGHYVAGMDSRKVIAHCNNCGHRWETDREWIK